ncbi:MAG: ATP-dependent sacrificial sulfur transferase LarE [Anaerolineae bacterium]
MPEQTKVQQLRNEIRQLESVAVAFSGGTDSTLLLAVSVQVLGAERVLAITADSPTLPRRELEDAEALASEIGVRQLVIETEELANPSFAQNPPDRCYYCKQELFTRMRRVADHEGFRNLIYGATAEDLGDYRPGMKAAQEAGASAPLLLAGFLKSDVRELSRQLGLRTWDKPAMACLSSRFPYGTPITGQGLTRVEQAEDLLRHELGLHQVRVRDQDTMARIEVETQDLARLVQEPARSQVIARLKALGYTYVTLNLEGFRSGSLNDVLVGDASPDPARTDAALPSERLVKGQ